MDNAERLAHQKKIHEDRIQNALAYQEVFATEAGKRVLKHLKMCFGWEQPVFPIDGRDVDVNAGLLQDGGRRVIYEIIANIEADLSRDQNEVERLEREINGEETNG